MDLIALGCHALNLGCRDVKSLLFIEFLMLFSMLAWDLGLWDFWNLDFGLSCFENDAIFCVLNNIEFLLWPFCLLSFTL